MSEYPQVNIDNAEIEILRLHGNIEKNIKDVKKMKVKYNKLCKKENKYYRPEALIEKLYIEKLKSKGIIYQSQVCIKNGRIDILTENEIIEIKKSSNRNSIFEAIGQLEYYSYYYPAHNKKILLDSYPNEQIINILKCMNITLEVIK